MASENETVADIVTEMHRLSRATIRNGLNVKDDPLHAVRKSACAAVHMFANRVAAAHQREVAELKRQREEALTVVNEVEKCASIERHTEAMLKKNGVIAGLRKEVAELQRRLKVAEDALERSPCGEVYQLGLVDDDGNCYNGIAIKFDENEGLKLPPVGHGDRFVVVPYSALAVIREEGSAS